MSGQCRLHNPGTKQPPNLDLGRLQLCVLPAQSRRPPAPPAGPPSPPIAVHWQPCGGPGAAAVARAGSCVCLPVSPPSPPRPFARAWAMGMGECRPHTPDPHPPPHPPSPTPGSRLSYRLPSLGTPAAMGTQSSRHAPHTMAGRGAARAGRVTSPDRPRVWMALTQASVVPGEYDTALTNAFGRSPVDPTQANWPGSIYMVGTGLGRRARGRWRWRWRWGEGRGYLGVGGHAGLLHTQNTPLVLTGCPGGNRDLAAATPFSPPPDPPRVCHAHHLHAACYCYGAGLEHGGCGAGPFDLGTRHTPLRGLITPTLSPPAPRPAGPPRPSHPLPSAPSGSVDGLYLGCPYTCLFSHPHRRAGRRFGSCNVMVCV